tara:strand:- start:58 stop:774 length:717 start_codon:yes stop_codon:yes gene_type:complete
MLSVEDKFCVLHYYYYFSNREEMKSSGEPLRKLEQINHWSIIEDDDVMYSGMDYFLEKIITTIRPKEPEEGENPFDTKPVMDDDMYVKAVKTVLWQALKNSQQVSSKEEAKKQANELLSDALDEMDVFLNECMNYFFIGVSQVGERNKLTGIPSNIWEAFKPRCGNAIPFSKFKTNYLLRATERRMGPMNQRQKKSWLRHIKRQFRGTEPEFYLDFEFDGTGKETDKNTSPTDDIGWQ